MDCHIRILRRMQKNILCQCFRLINSICGGVNMEKWDAYDSNFKKIDGKILIRGEEKDIPNGVYHLVCDILVRHTDGSYLLMKRDYRKHYGGMWEATAGGSALIGETPLQCAIRELKEETGIETSALTKVGTEFNDKAHSVYVEFLCVTNWDKTYIQMQDGETIDYKWVNREDLITMSKNELVTERMQKYIDELK